MSALNTQTGGNHYKNFAIQPIESTMKNGLGFIEGNIIKYVSRHKLKNGAEDIMKVKHYAELLLELEYNIVANEETFEKKMTRETFEAVVNQPATGEELSMTNLINGVVEHKNSALLLKTIIHRMLLIDWEATQETINQTVQNHAMVEDAVLIDIKWRE